MLMPGLLAMRGRDCNFVLRATCYEVCNARKPAATRLLDFSVESAVTSP